MKNIRSFSLTAALLFSSAGIVHAATVTLVSENFDSMGSAAGTVSAPAGWTVGYLGTAGTQNRLAMSPYAGDGQAITPMTIYTLAAAGVDYRTNYNGGTISDVGHVYNAGDIGAADRALGNYPRTSPSGDQIMQFAFTNISGAAITTIHLEYDMEQWGQGQGASTSGAEMVRVLLSSTSDITGFNYMGSGLDGVAPLQGAGSSIAVIDGNANKVHVSGDFTLPSSVAAGGNMWLRFHDWNDNGTTDHLLAIDNVVMTTEVIPEPSTLALFGLVGLVFAARRRRSVR